MDNLGILDKEVLVSNKVCDICRLYIGSKDRYYRMAEKE
jgi:hypothetical protein